MSPKMKVSIRQHAGFLKNKIKYIQPCEEQKILESSTALNWIITGAGTDKLIDENWKNATKVLENLADEEV